MGINSKVHKIRHEQHIAYVARTVEHVAWIRRRKVDIEREIFDNEIDGFGDGFVDLVLTLCGVNGPGFAPMMAMGARFVNVRGTEKVTGDIYYYNGFEVGSNLSHEAMALDRYSKNEQIVEPPSWMALPFIEGYEEEVDDGEVGQDVKEGAGGGQPSK